MGKGPDTFTVERKTPVEIEEEIIVPEGDLEASCRIGRGSPGLDSDGFTVG